MRDVSLNMVEERGNVVSSEETTSIFEFKGSPLRRWTRKRKSGGKSRIFVNNFDHADKCVPEGWADRLRFNKTSLDE